MHGAFGPSHLVEFQLSPYRLSCVMLCFRNLIEGTFSHIVGLSQRCDPGTLCVLQESPEVSGRQVEGVV